MTMVQLNSGRLRCTIALQGAELRSLLDVQARDEYIWQRDPLVWADSAPILFPVVGRLRGGAYLHDGQRYPMPIHGFARTAEFSVMESCPNSATLVLRESPETLACYPFRFVLQVAFTLEAHCLHVRYRVCNPGAVALPFSLGSHPGFRLPKARSGGWNLAFSDEEEPLCYRLDGNLLEGNLLARAPEALELAGGRHLQLTPDLFARDALIFKRIRSRHVRLQERNGRVRLSVATGGAPSLGLWSRPGADYICIEPWHGYDDDAETTEQLAGKPGIVVLPPGQHFYTEYAICVPPAPGS
jgi:galactose mutarotase-like enzyme